MSPLEYSNAAGALVRSEVPDLSARQMAIFMSLYTHPSFGPLTIRGLAKDLKIPKPSVTTSVDKLVERDLVRRTMDHGDLRSVLVCDTLQGLKLFRQIKSILKSIEVNS